VTRKSFVVFQILALVCLTAAWLSLLFVDPQKADAAAAFVQATSAFTGCGTTATTPAITTHIGDVFIVSIMDGGASPTVTDSMGNTYVAALPVQTGANSVTLQTFYSVTGKGGPNHTFTVTVAATCHLHVHVHEVSGITRSNPVDQTTAEKCRNRCNDIDRIRHNDEKKANMLMRSLLIQMFPATA
jgi:hypothetical protein